jgi:hypothetical protein
VSQEVTTGRLPLGARRRFTFTIAPFLMHERCCPQSVQRQIAHANLRPGLTVNNYVKQYPIEHPRQWILFWKISQDHSTTNDTQSYRNRTGRHWSKSSIHKWEPVVQLK